MSDTTSTGLAARVPDEQRVRATPIAGTTTRPRQGSRSTCRRCRRPITWSDRHNAWQHPENDDAWCPVGRPKQTLRERYAVRGL